MTYGAQLWWKPGWKRQKWALKELEQAQRRAAIWITGAFKTTPTGALNMMAGLIPVEHQINKYMQRAALRTRTLHSSHPVRAALPDCWLADPEGIQPLYQLGKRNNPAQVSPLKFIHEAASECTEQFDADRKSVV